MTAASDASAAPPGPGRGAALLLWLGLLVAFSPVLLDLVRHLTEHPWAFYAAVFPALFARCALAETARPPIHRSGTLWIAAGMLLEIVGVLAVAVRVARVGLALAAMGLCRRFGFASGRSLVLLAFAVPLPTAVLGLATPETQSALLGAARAILGVAGVAVQVDGLQARVGAEILALELFDGGVPLVPLLAGLSWYRSLLLRVPTRAALGRAAAATLLAIPVQLTAIAVALLALPITAEGPRRLALTSIPWLAVTAVSVVRTELRVRRENEP